MQKVLNDETPLYKLGFLSSLNEERLERIWSSRDQWQVNKENIHLHWSSFRKKFIIWNRSCKFVVIGCVTVGTYIKICFHFIAIGLCERIKYKACGKCNWMFAYMLMLSQQQGVHNHFFPPVLKALWIFLNFKRHCCPLSRAVFIISSDPWLSFHLILQPPYHTRLMLDIFTIRQMWHSWVICPACNYAFGSG